MERTSTSSNNNNHQNDNEMYNNKLINHYLYSLHVFQKHITSNDSEREWDRENTFNIAAKHKKSIQ